MGQLGRWRILTIVSFTCTKKKKKMEQARALGNAFVTRERFDAEVRRLAGWEHLDAVHRVAAMLRKCGDDFPLYSEYVTSEVWTNNLLRAFFMRGPLDSMLLALRPEQSLCRAGNVYPFFRLVASDLDNRGMERIVTTLSSTFARVAAHTPFITQLCDFLLFCGYHGSNIRTMLAEPTLYCSLSKRLNVRTAEAIFAWFMFEDNCERVQASPLVMALDGFFFNFAPGRHDTDVFASYRLALEKCMTYDMWRSWLLPTIVRFGRWGWPPDFGSLLRLTLASTSVEFLLRAHDASVLQLLVRAASERAGDDMDWKHVNDALRRKWPRFYSMVLNMPVSTHTVTSAMCPITLEPMVTPAVASDGHTYERDALLEHLTKNGRTSPMTKETLSFHVFDNFAVQS